MNPENLEMENTPSNHKKKMFAERFGFYKLLGTIILAPIVFWPSQYIALDTVKTVIIGLGILSAAIYLCILVLKEKKLVLPPKRILWTSILLIASLVISAFASTHAGKSLFGQGFELNTVSYIATIFLGGLVTFTFVLRRIDRAVILYVGIFVAYFIVFLFQLLRMIFGVNFAAFNVFVYQTSTLLGNWFDLGTLSILAVLISLCAIMLLPLSKKMKLVYWTIAVLSAFAAFVVNNPHAWFIAFLVLLGVTISMSVGRIKGKGFKFVKTIKHLAWVPLIACIVAGILFSKGTSIASPVVKALNVPYTEVSLPWQATLDVAVGAIKQNPLFGVGANHFSNAYLQDKPDMINLSDGWNIEFGYGFGFIPTLIVEQGMVGLILWILFFVFFGLAGARVIRKLSADMGGGNVHTAHESAPRRFIIISSFIGATFLWLVAIVSVPSHIVLLFTLVMTGIFFGSSESKNLIIQPGSNKGTKVFSVIMVIVMILTLVWGMIYVKKVIALSYFAVGAKGLNSLKDPDLALASFTKAYNVDHLDVYLQGKAEAELMKAGQIATSINASQSGSTQNASSTEALIKQFGETVNNALLDARSAIAYDKSDYFNYISEARVSEVAVNLKMPNAYDDAVAAYMNAIKLNPKNPSIYLNLARLQINQNKLDDAIQTIGAALKVKPNYLDAVFILSQVYAAKGDLTTAVTAAKFATQLNPENPQVFFQLGILQYNNKDYAGAATSLETASKLQADYANAQYFLGLSYARLGKTKEATGVFQQLSKTNPDNQEVLTILQNLSAGKSIFTDPKVVVSPEKRTTLPIKTPVKK